MNYIYLPGFPNHPINNRDHSLDAYEHIGEEMRAHTLTFVGTVDGFLHRLRLEPLKNEGKMVYHPVLTPLKYGEVIDVATPRDTVLLASGP